MSYQDKLKDPRWQKMRLEIMERDGFKCRKCEAKDKTLHVHHTYYKKGAEPWEYARQSMLTLCKTCHENTEELIESCKVDYGSLFVSDCISGETASEIMTLLGDYENESSRAGDVFISAEDFLIRCATWAFYHKGLKAGKQTSIK